MIEIDEEEDFITKYKIPLGMGLVGLVLLVGGVLSSGVFSKTFIRSSTNYSQSKAPVSNVVVDISGAVVNPGVYQLQGEARLEDAIKVAGGIIEEADQRYISKSLNMAQKISDGTKVYIPFEGEGGAVAGASISSESQININTTSLRELDSLPGIGPVTAQKIIDNRPYQSLEELITKKAVSKAVYEKIKTQITTN